jgi:O-antigen/teichoic acid export membrane protein
MLTAKRVVKNAGFLYIKLGITMFISLYTTRLILNSLGTSDFGIFSIVAGTIGMMGFLNASMAGATIRFMSYAKGEGDIEKQKRIFNVTIILHFFISIFLGFFLLILGYFIFNRIINIPSERLYAAHIIYYFMIVSTMFTVMTVPYDAVLNAHENMFYYAIVGIIESILKLAVALIVVNTHIDKLIVYGGFMAGISLIVMIIMRVYCHKHYTECVFSFKEHYDKDLLREMTSFAGWNFFGSFVIIISLNGQGLILNHFFGTLLNAAQGITNQISGQLQTLSNNLLKALNPILDKSAGANDNDLLLKSTMLGAKYSTALFLFVAIPIFFELPYVLKLWLNIIPDWTIFFIRFQLIKSFIEFQFATLPGVIVAVGKIKRYTFWSSMSNMLQLPVMFLFYKFNFPPYYMYISTIIFGNIIVYSFALYYVKIYCGLSVNMYFKNVLYPVYQVLILVIITLFIIKKIIFINTITALIFFILVAFIIFVICFFYIGCAKYEKFLIITIIKNKVYKLLPKSI